MRSVLVAFEILFGKLRSECDGRLMASNQDAPLVGVGRCNRGALGAVAGNPEGGIGADARQVVRDEDLKAVQVAAACDAAVEQLGEPAKIETAPEPPASKRGYEFL